MKANATRLRRLEQHQSGPAAPESERLVISTPVWPLNLAESICTRTLAADGLLTEIVRLKGMRENLTDEELEAFIAKFPIERV